MYIFVIQSFGSCFTQHDNFCSLVGIFRPFMYISCNFLLVTFNFPILLLVIFLSYLLSVPFSAFSVVLWIEYNVIFYLSLQLIYWLFSFIFCCCWGGSWGTLWLISLLPSNIPFICGIRLLGQFTSIYSTPIICTFVTMLFIPTFHIITLKHFVGLFDILNYFIRKPKRNLKVIKCIFNLLTYLKILCSSNNVHLSF